MEDIKSLWVERPVEDLVRSGHEYTWASEYQEIANARKSNKVRRHTETSVVTILEFLTFIHKVHLLIRQASSSSNVAWAAPVKYHALTHTVQYTVTTTSRQSLSIHLLRNAKKM